MRILYFSPWFPYPLDTGSRIRVYYLLRALAQHHQITLLTLDPQGWAPAQVDTVSPLCEHVAIVPRDPFQPGRLRKATRFFSMQPIVADPFPELLEMVQQLHATRPFDAVIAATGVMASYALALNGPLQVLEEHNSHTRWMHGRYQAQASPVQRLRCWVSWRKSALYESRLFPRFDLVTMVSEQDRQACLGLLPGYQGRVEVVPNGVDCGYNHPGLAEPWPNSLVFNGALTYESNYDAMRYFLSEVYPLVRRESPDASLTITGSTVGVDLSGLPLEASVRLSGYVENVRPLVAEAWICVVPIREGGGTRLKILEAMALGTPVVATSKGAEGLDITPGRDILIADEPAEFTSQVLRLFHDRELRQHLAHNARRLVKERYDWTAIGACFVDLVEAAAEEGRTA